MTTCTHKILCVVVRKKRTYGCREYVEKLSDLAFIESSCSPHQNSSHSKRTSVAVFNIVTIVGSYLRAQAL